METHFPLRSQVIWFSVIYGLYHGLVFLPVMLSWFGPEPFSDTTESTEQAEDNQSPVVSVKCHPEPVGREQSFISKVW